MSPAGRIPNTPPERFGDPRPLGTDDEGDPIPVDTKPVKPTPKPSGSVELTFVGDYTNPWASNPSAEIAMIKAGATPGSGKHWSPGTIDFQAMASNTKLAPTFDSFLAWLLQEKNGSVSRVNIITHGDFSRIGFKGRIDQANGDVFFDNDPNASLDLTTLASWQSKPLVDENGTSHSFAEIKAKFAPGAEIFFYSCKGASDPQLLQEIANAFGVKVNGSSKEVVFCVDFTEPPPQVNRNLFRVAINDQSTAKDSCDIGGKKNFHDLSLNRAASPKAKTP